MVGNVSIVKHMDLPIKIKIITTTKKKKKKKPLKILHTV